MAKRETKLPKRFVFAMTVEEMKAVQAILWSVAGTFDKSRRRLIEDVSDRLDKVVGVPCLCDVSGFIKFLDEKNRKKQRQCGVCLDEALAEMKETKRCTRKKTS